MSNETGVTNVTDAGNATGTTEVTDDAADRASNLRAIFEILSYIHADALKDNYKELADRIEFALNLAEQTIKSGANAPASPTPQPAGQSDAAAPVPVPEQVIPK